MGYSAGGMFCTYALFASSEAFDKYICGSPDLYIDDSHVFNVEGRYAKTHEDLNAEVFFSFGELEITQDVISGLGIASSVVRMTEILNNRKYPSLDLHIKVLPGYDHSSALYMTAYWGLRGLGK